MARRFTRVDRLLNFGLVRINRQQHREMVLRAGMPAADQLETALAIPPPAEYTLTGAWVQHLAAPRSDLVSVLVAEALQLPQSIVLKLLHFGAIHACPVMPALNAERRRHLPAEQVEDIDRRREAAAAAAGHRNSALSMPRRLAEDGVVPQHSYIRVHVVPKRFPAFYAADWRRRVIAEGDDWVVVHKPGGVPVCPTVDNVLENVLAGAALATGRQQALLITSRLDTPTEGVVVLGKTGAFVQRFNALVRASGGGKASPGAELPPIGSAGDAGSGSTGGPGAPGCSTCGPAAPALRKFYRAVTSSPPLLGRMSHHLSVGRRLFPLPQHTLVLPAAAPGSQRAELDVLEVQRVALSGEAAALWGCGEAGAGAAAYEVSIELLTGRTHQIRAQLSAAGCPLLGDDMYKPLASAELRRRLLEEDPSLPLVGSDERRLLEEPAGAIGLQACRLEVAAGGVFGQGPAAFEAGPPWWRQKA